jgi:hypothetical protein
MKKMEILANIGIILLTRWSLVELVHKKKYETFLKLRRNNILR